MLYGLNDFTIIPAKISQISSRSECNPCFENKLPLFTAPMSCVINVENWETFNRNKINTIIPRNISFEKRLCLAPITFIAVSLDEFRQLINLPKFSISYKICVDIANGHMCQLLDLCKMAKEKHGKNIIIMTGNIANSETYLEYAKVGIDYVRLGIGNGSVCTTSANSGVHYPLGSLIKECSNIRRDMDYEKLFYKVPEFRRNSSGMWVSDKTLVLKSIPKIVADGGFKNFDQIIKALALGGRLCNVGWNFC